MDAKKAHIHTEKIKLLYTHSLTPALLSGIVGLLLVAALWNSANRQHLLIWLSITLILCVVRVSLISAFRRTAPKGDAIFAWEKPYSISLIAVFLVWSLGLIFIMPKENLTSVFILNTFSIGLAGAAISWYSQLRYLQITTISLALIPMIIVLLTLGSEPAWWIGIAACCMYVSCLITSAMLQKTYTGNLELAYDLEKAMQHAERMARTDVLTGLNNRRAFFDHGASMLAQCYQLQVPVSLIMFDLDHFKKINDEFGHMGGDMALQHVANLLSHKLRCSDISCRFGGEEFAVLLPNTSLEDAKATAEKLRVLIETMPFIYQHKAISITASFGITDSGENLDEMINRADQVMYKAKKNGRNQIGADTHHRKAIKLQPKKSDDLRTALKAYG